MGFWGEGPFRSGSSEGSRDFYKMTEKGRKRAEFRDKMAARQEKNDNYGGCAFLALAMAGGVVAALAALGAGVVRLVS